MRRLAGALGVVFVGIAVVVSAQAPDTTTMLAGFLNGLRAGTITLATSGSKLTNASDGVITLTNNAGTSFDRLQFGGSTASFPALRVSGTQLQVKLADNSAFTSLAATSFALQGTGSFSVGATVLIGSTAPTVSSGFGTGASIPNNNGTGSFTVGVGTTSAATGVIGLPTASHGWTCSCTDITTKSATVYLCKQTATGTATATVGNFDAAGAAQSWVDSDVLQVSCLAY